MSKHPHKNATLTHAGPGKPATLSNAAGDNSHDGKLALQEDIRVGAYQKWEAAGKPSGDGVQFARKGDMLTYVDDRISEKETWLLSRTMDSPETISQQIGEYLVIAHGAEDSVKTAHKILSGSRTEQLDLHAPATVRPPGST